MMCTLVALILSTAPADSAHASGRQDSLPSPLTMPSITEYILSHIEHFAAPELRAKLRERSAIKQDGYSRVLFDESRGDGLFALFSYIKYQLQILYAVPNEILWVIPPRMANGFGIAYPFTWEMPDDPWRKQWWNRVR